MRSAFILVTGVAFVGATLGYMVGGSATPVVSVAIPAVFGLVVTAIGLVQGAAPTKEYAELLKAAGADAENIPEVAAYRSRARTAPQRVGIALIVFCISYVAAATVGAKVRIDNVLAGHAVAKPFPWAGHATSPPTISSALEWIALQSRLRGLGYDDRHIRELYEIQVQEWKALAAAAKMPAAPEAARKQPEPAAASGPDPAQPVSAALSPSPGAEREEFLKKLQALPETPKGNPFAHQPPRELIDKLRDAGSPGGRMPS